MSRQTESKAAAIKQTLEYEGEWAKRAVELLEEGRALKAKIGDKGDEKKDKDGSGLLWDLAKIERELTEIINEHGLEGVRFNKSVFTVSAREGRTSVDVEVLKKELLVAGVDLSVVRSAVAAATKVGDAYYVREWKEIK